MSHPKPGTRAFGQRARQRRDNIAKGVVFKEKQYTDSTPAAGTSERGRSGYADARRVQDRLSTEREMGVRRGRK